MKNSRGVLLLTGSLLLSTQVLSQGNPASGHRLYGAMSGTDTYLVDTSGAIVHTWRSSHRPGLGAYVLDDGSLLRAIALGPVGGSPGGGGGLQRHAFDGTLLWDYRYLGPGYQSHHDIEPLPNGNVLLIAWEEKTRAEAIAAGRDPVLISASTFRLDHIVEVQPTGPTTGNIVWEWHVWDHVIQDFDSNQANYGVVASHPELMDINYPADVETSDDWNHFNGIDYDSIHDWIVVSAHSQDEIWIIDHGTTTAEAAGHRGGRWGKGGDLLYRWGNPAAYRAGTTADQQLFGQHAPTFVPTGYPGAGHVVVFNNQLPSNTSSVVELALPLDPVGNFVFGPFGKYGPIQPAWTYTAPDFWSLFISSAERLPNGNTLVCSGAQRWLFEVTPSGQRVWEHRDSSGFIFHTHHVQRSLWASGTAISAAGGGTIGFDLVAGADHAGDHYLVLGSATGTTPGIPISGFTLPLNGDAFLDFTFTNPNRGPALTRTLGTLSAAGAARASFGLPPRLVPPSLTGLRLHFAYIAVDPNAWSVTATSNAVSVIIDP